jgi:hypothetical protein
MTERQKNLSTESYPNRNDAGQQLGASFRDPSGFLFTLEGVLYRQINQSYRENFDHLIDSGLYQDLVDVGLLIPHSEAPIPADQAGDKNAYKIIRPEPVQFISYPYEWSFSQLKNAALATLDIQKRALKFGMSLKDSSAYNIQFHDGRPVLIDSLSFEIYSEGKPWVAYRQFCQHFLATLSLMASRDVRLGQLLRIYIDGIPLDLTSKLLPARTRLALPLLLHIHLHATSQRRYASRMNVETKQQVSRTAFLGLIDSLESGIRGLQWSGTGTEWGDYYQDHNYTPAGLQHKEQLVNQLLDLVQPHSVWDLGANTGLFSRLASERSIPTLAFDVDPGAVERNYLDCISRRETKLLPLLLDLANPSPSLGWNHQERLSFLERGPADMVLALALIHHLAIANNVPLARLASFFKQLGQWLVIEFVPKSDSQVRRLLATRADIFPSYQPQTFEAVFAEQFIIHRVEVIQDSERRLYLMEKR